MATYIAIILTLHLILRLVAWLWPYAGQRWTERVAFWMRARRMRKEAETYRASLVIDGRRVEVK